MDRDNLNMTLADLGLEDGSRIFITENDVVPKDVQLWADLSLA